MEETVQVRVRPPRLYTGHRVLDDLLEGFEPAQLTFLNSGSPFVHQLVFQLCVRHIVDFDREVVFVDGGNSINPYALATLAKREGRGRQDILQRIRVARAFTAYQMATILLESLEEEVRGGPGMLVLSCLGNLFLDEDVEYAEAYHLLRRGLKTVRTLVQEEEMIGLVTNHGLSQLAARRGIGNLLHEMTDRLIHIRPRKGGLQVAVPEEDRSALFIPVPLSQAVLEDYVPQPFAMGMARLRVEATPPPPARRGQQIEISTYLRR